MGILIRWLVLTIAILAASYLIDGMYVKGFSSQEINLSGVSSALIAAAILGILNALLRPILIILTLPINILTLGLFTFIINALLLQLASSIVPNIITISTFWVAVKGALVISLTSWLMNLLISDRARFRYVRVKRDDRGERSRQIDDDVIDMRKGRGGDWE